MHSALLLPIGLILAILVTLSGAKTTTTTRCDTTRSKGRGTTTFSARPTTTHVTVTVRPVLTSTRIVEGRPTTVTVAALANVVETATAPVETDVFTTTTTLIAVLVPSSTVTAAAFTPTSTAISVTTFTTTSTVTTYDVSPALPSLSILTRRKNNKLSDVAGEDALIARNSRGGERCERSQFKRKVVHCRRVVRKTTTVTKGKPKTVTVASTNYRTATNTLAVTATSTSTVIPADATSVRTETAQSTITAPTVVFTTTPTAPATTVTLAVQVSATAQSISHLTTNCAPGVAQTRYGNGLSSTSGQTFADYPAWYGDERLCCNAAATTSGSVGYAWTQDAACFIVSLKNAAPETCVWSVNTRLMAQQISNTPGGFSLGLVNCGTGFGPPA